MKYWKTALSIFALSASLGLAEDFRTTKGKEYKDATISRVEPDGIVIKFHGGIVKLPFAELPSDVQKKYEYDPVAAREYAAHRDRVIPPPTATPDANLRTSEADGAQTNARGLNAAEQWVVDQVTADKAADLSKQFPEEKDRKLRAHFLEDLLTSASPRHGVRIEKAIIDEAINLENAQIPSDVQMNQCQFNNKVTLAKADFAGRLSFDNSTFKDRADFSGVKVRGDEARFHATMFEGPVYFIKADIEGTFEAIGAKFQNKEFGVSFAGMKVGGDVYFDVAVFGGVAGFVGADVANNFEAKAARFQSEKRAAAFIGMKVGRDASFDDAVFEGPVYFLKADIEGNFEATAAKFQNKEKGASFSGMKVRGDEAVFNSAVFEGQVSFGGADIAHDFVMQSAKFPNKEKDVVFLGMKVRGNALFDYTVFEGLVDFVGVDIANNFQAGAKFHHEKKGAFFNRMKVGGQTFFNGAFKGPVDLRYADFGSLDLSGASLPKLTSQLQMQGMSYKTILAAPKEPKSHEELLKVVSQAAYSADVYSRLEEFFLRQGYRADADEAFIAGRLREREEYSPRGRGVREYVRSGDWLRWIGSTILYLLVGYGRHPWQAGIYCAALIALGCVLFSPNKMEPQRPEDTPRVYSRFWYSLNLFLPVVDLQAGKVWKPKADQTFLRNYMRVHILLGWILIPLVLAVLTGLIK